MVEEIVLYYQKKIRRDYGNLDFGQFMPTNAQDGSGKPRIPLSDIFLPVDFCRYRDKSDVIVTTSEMLTDTSDRVILAGPGYGKTTFLKFLLLNLFNYNRVPIYFEWKSLVTQLETKKKNKRQTFSSILENHLKGLLLGRYRLKGIKELIREHHFVFLIDGIDEVDQTEYQLLFKPVFERYKNAHPQHTFILASRIANYSNDYFSFFSQNGFLHYEMKGLSELLISQYINNFIKYQLPTDTLKRAEKIKFLTRYIDSQPGIKALAEHPLLLNLIVLIYVFEGSLPDTKVNLYDRCIELLIYVWIKTSRDIKAFNELSLHSNTLHALLAEIAYEYFNQFIDGSVKEFGSLTGSAFRRILKRIYRNISRMRMEDAEIESAIVKIFDYIKKNTGVIVESAPDVYGFPHLSILEYLAASRIVAEKSDYKTNLDYIIDMLKHPKFDTVKEVILFQVELLSKSTSQTKFTDLLARKLIPLFQRTKNRKILILLGTLLRDNQDFSIRDTKEILKLLTTDLARNPKNVELDALLDDIFLLSGDSRHYLIELLGRSTREREIWENFSQRTAHRIGNRVFSIRSSMNIIEKNHKTLSRNAAVDKIGEKIEKVQQQMDSLNAILREYADYAADIVIDYKEHEINAILSGIANKYKKHYPGVVIRCCPTCSERVISFTDKGRMEQIIEELIENSIKHGGNPSSLTIFLSLELQEEKFVIHYRDNGKGVPEALKEKIFEPFYTLNSRSTGIGLANIRKTVESLNGEIMETGTENEGAHFELLLDILGR